MRMRPHSAKGARARVAVLSGMLAQVHGALFVGALTVAIAAADPLPEPPADADPATDYTAAPDDSVDSGSVSVGYGLSGRAGRTPGASRTLRFRGDSVEAGVREGDADADAGGDVSSRTHGRVLRIGRIAPAWGRGLAVGAPADPWTVRQRSAAGPFEPRARGGDGVSCAWPGLGVDGFAGRVGGHEVFGLGLARRGVRLGSVSARGRPQCVSLAVEREDGAFELALSSARRWRAEATMTGGSTVLGGQLRMAAGDESFQAPLAPARATPSRAAVATIAAGSRALRCTATLAGWRYRVDAPGTRAGLEVVWRNVTRGVWSAGFEEQHGARRAPSATAKLPGMRQGAWLEWRGETPIAALTVRSERWGSRPFVRARVRESLAMGVEAPLPNGMSVHVSHTVYRAHSGETVYVPERDTDRWVLRALSGAGDRTRATLKLPLAEGTLSSSLVMTRARGPAKTQWAMQWSRRIRLRRGV